VSLAQNEPVAVGIAKAKTEAPALILLDIMMPEMDGFETLERLKAEPATKSIPVVMLTARLHQEDIVRAIRLGATDYIMKPFELKILVEKIRRVLKKHGKTIEVPPADAGAAAGYELIDDENPEG